MYKLYLYSELFVSVHTYLSIHPSTHLSINLSIRSFIFYSSIYTSIHPKANDHISTSSARVSNPAPGWPLSGV